MTKKPEQSRKASRHAILKAAETLVRDTRATDFSMRVLAKRAGVSPATPYNVFGTKASILYVLLNQSLDAILSDFNQASVDIGPFERVMAAADAAVSFFLADPDFYRPLYHHLIGVSDPEHRGGYMDRALAYWRAALAGMCDGGFLDEDVERDTMARAIMIVFIGGLDLWVQSELTAREFHGHIMHAVASLLFRHANSKGRAHLEKTIDTAKRDMPRSFSFARRASP